MSRIKLCSFGFWLKSCWQFPFSAISLEKAWDAMKLSDTSFFPFIAANVSCLDRRYLKKNVNLVFYLGVHGLICAEIPFEPIKLWQHKAVVCGFAQEASPSICGLKHHWNSANRSPSSPLAMRDKITKLYFFFWHHIDWNASICFNRLYNLHYYNIIIY